MFDENHRFILKDYQSMPPFSSFLPGIAGPMGVPVWCYYNNRGQAVCSFGARDKDHAIMEFDSAHASYQNVSRTGFRTFCKVNGEYRELFTEKCDMHIGMSEVEIRSRGGSLEASVVYFGVPGERTAALARVLTVKNAGEAAAELELLDGVPALVPYGVSQDSLKNMSNLAKAWMQVEDMEEGRAYFRVRASMADTACVTKVEGGNFCLAWNDSGTRLKPIVQPSVIFGEDTAFAAAGNFRNKPLAELCGIRQVTQNLFPCCFLPHGRTLRPGEEMTIYSIYGQAEDKTRVAALAGRVEPLSWFAGKRQEAAELVESLCFAVAAKTADPVFDAYARQTYLDNLLRGGVPTFFRHDGKSVPYYLYSRKHGDPEREYNYFSLGREYYAQGNGNFRDVNQNRRCDVLFAPEVGAENIHTFFDLIQTDGYNPLVVTPSTYTLPQEAQAEFIARYPQGAELLSGSFTPGQVAMAAEDWGMAPREAQAFTAEVVCAACSEPNATFSEGYWCDHWTYNLDLIESYLAVYPERKEQLLFGDRRYRWYETRVLVNPRAKRYEMTKNGLRQYHALDETAKETNRKWMCHADGTQAESSLVEKLILLGTIKTATLDPAGMGVEMEGGKPGWYDALNGLPGLLGSSLAESCELARLLDFTARALENREGTVELYTEVAGLLAGVDTILTTQADPYVRWDRLNFLKEAYRSDTVRGFRGARQKLSCAAVAAVLRRMEETVLSGIRRATDENGGLIPTYLTFSALRVTDTPEGPMPTEFRAEALPLFLEGPVRYLKLDLGGEEKWELAKKVRASGLYDRKLKMYKVNDSLENVSFEAGRAKAFTPGWLENESIWLHMEYKYLLELLKSGLYGEFAEAFRDAAVPFLDPQSYGRSPLENVSFIASSANPDPATHGRGYVARLSGSTAEFLHMWQLMFFGPRPFRVEAGELCLEFTPFIPEYLMPADGIVETTFLGSIPVRYQAEGCRELRPGVTEAAGYALTDSDGNTVTVPGKLLRGEYALAVRGGQVSAIHVTMK
ncbi:MAG: hypothetical protein IJ001_02020 [Oscillospiraceae bacterium]|nr:hypothetical protein [Oscillospiraceae bacterium]